MVILGRVAESIKSNKQSNKQINEMKLFGVPTVTPNSRQGRKETKGPYLDCYIQVLKALKKVKAQYKQKIPSEKKTTEQAGRIDHEIKLRPWLLEAE